jgi:acyl-CoA synthetase (AMP-forming)/AMP-acid ligase II
LNSDATLTAEQILAHARKNLSKYKLPVEITILDQLPKNAVGKLDKPSMRKFATAPAAGA